MPRWSYISKLPLRLACCLLLMVSCGSRFSAQPAEVLYCVQPSRPESAPDIKAADYLRKHLQHRTDKRIIVPHDTDAGCTVFLHVGDDFGGDWKIVRGEKSITLTARNERTMTWLIYQFIKEAGTLEESLLTEDLPPSILPQGDTVATFPFVYRDIYMPSNQDPDMTGVLGLHNLEADWGLWGHQLSRVLGTNGDANFGFQNMDQELFAKTGGLVVQDQFCFSSDKLYELTVQYILEQFGDGTRFPMRFTIGPNDNGHVCECRRCQTFGNTRTNATPAVTRFIERLATRFPNHTFFIPGYSTTAAVPDHRLPANVGVFLSAIDYPRIYGNADSPAAQKFFHTLDEWKKVTGTIYIWDYINNFDDYLTPYPILSVMQQRLLEYEKRGVKGIFLNGSGYFYSILQETYTFILADLLLDPHADIEKLVRAYYADVMPHLGTIYSNIMLSNEAYFRASGKELPMYGGIEEVLQTYRSEEEFMERYNGQMSIRLDELTPREKAIFLKTRQLSSYTFLEICRKNGLGENGFAIRTDDGWEVKSDVLVAIQNLRDITSEDDIYLLTGSSYASLDHMDRINEAGVYIADYEMECARWLSAQEWNENLILLQPLTVHTKEGTVQTNRLTNGVAGISQNYHWGWSIFPQENLTIDLPADKMAEAKEISVSFLNFERHRLSPPAAVSLWVDGHMVKQLHRETVSNMYDEGERVTFADRVDVGPATRVELRFNPSRTRDLALDEIVVK